jgi:MFS transporter, NRE family, putaive nickel resistance protein
MSGGLVRNANFAKLFSAQVISLTGSGVTTVALALYVHQLAGPSAATAVLGQALMLRIVAFLVFSQPAGVLADSHLSQKDPDFHGYRASSADRYVSIHQ